MSDEPKFAPMPTIPPETEADRRASQLVQVRLGYISREYIAEVLARAERAEAEVARLREVLAPFALAASLHGVRRVGRDDLWVSLGVASSAWVAAGAALADSEKEE